MVRYALKMSSMTSKQVPLEEPQDEISATSRRRPRCGSSKKCKPTSNLEMLSEDDATTSKGDGTTRRRSGRNAHKVVDYAEAKPKPPPAMSVIVKGLNCPEATCTALCADRKTLKEHLTQAHGFGPNRCIISGCAESFTNHFKLADHFTDAHSHLSLFPCSHCQTACKTYRELRVHLRACHQRGLYECSVAKCSFKSTTLRPMEIHQASAHRDPFIPWRKCSVYRCGKLFSSAKHLRVHKRSHTGERPFGCRTCGKTFTIEAIRVRHEKIHTVASSAPRETMGKKGR